MLKCSGSVRLDMVMVNGGGMVVLIGLFIWNCGESDDLIEDVRRGALPT